MKNKEKIKEILRAVPIADKDYPEYIDALADKLIAEGVIVTPCVAMVEQFIKDGKFDRLRTTYNGRTAVVYIDKSKWDSPLIDITEQSYNTEKALERIQALKGTDK